MLSAPQFNRNIRTGIDILIVCRELGDIEKDMALQEEQEAISRENRLPYGIALSLTNQAGILAEKGRTSIRRCLLPEKPSGSFKN